MKIGIDIDDTLAAFNYQFLNFINRRDGTNFQFKDITDYNYNKAFGTTGDRMYTSVFDFYKSPEFLEIIPVEGSQEAIKILKKDHELFVITSRNEDLSEITDNWLKNFYGDSFKHIVHANTYTQNKAHKTVTKGEIGSLLKLDLMVEDALHHVFDLAEHDINSILLDKPWNQVSELLPRIKRVPNWPSAVEYINFR